MKHLWEGNPSFPSIFKKANIISETQDDYRFKRDEGRMKPAEVYCKEILEIGVDS
jgi:hypothetical protein